MCVDPTGGFLDFCSIQQFYANLLPFNHDWLTYILSATTLVFIVFNALILTTALYTWFERRTLGRFQARLGPNRWGPFGLLQPFADILKLISKEIKMDTSRLSTCSISFSDRYRTVSHNLLSGPICSY